MDGFFRQRPRFTVVRVEKNIPHFVLSRAKAEVLEPWEEEWKNAGADSVVLTQVQKKAAGYQIALWAAVLNPPEVLFETEVSVQDPYSLKSFAAATQDALAAFVRGLPFDASVISRQGYRVILDRGSPSFRAGSRLPVFTLEKKGNGLDLQETGTIQIQRVDRDLSFATVLAENKPLEVEVGNKVRFQARGLIVDNESEKVPSLRAPVISRDVASAPGSLTVGEAEFMPREKWVHVEVQAAANLLSWERVQAGTGTTHTDSGFYPGARVKGDLKLTKDGFAELDCLLGSGSLTSNASGSNVGVSSGFTQLRVLGGVRFSLADAAFSPRVFLRGGYSMTSYSVKEQDGLVAPTSASFTGLLIGTGAVLPISPVVDIGIDMNGLFFSSINEPGGTSGASPTGVSGWDFALTGVYRLAERTNIDMRLVFQSNAASFTGVGKRPISFASLNQTSRSFMLGLSYAF
jgi:hypothetical protein